MSISDPSHRVVRPRASRRIPQAAVDPAVISELMGVAETPRPGRPSIPRLRFMPIVSFPKSGNTWLRSIFSHLLYDGTLESIPNKYTTGAFGGAIAEVGNGVHLRMYKSHDRVLASTIGLYEVRHMAAVHIIRHPLDVFLSLLNYLLLDPQGVHPDLRPGEHSFAFPPPPVEDIISSKLLDVFFKAFVLHGTLMPTFYAAGNWFEHNEYWRDRDEEDIPIFRIRYEDLVSQGAPLLYPLARHLGRTAADMDIAFAAAAADTVPDGRFFWKQAPGQYREVLSPSQLELFCKTLGERTAALGYEA